MHLRNLSPRLLSILYLIDSSVILPYQSWKPKQTFHLGQAVFHKPLTGGGQKSVAPVEAMFLCQPICQSYACTHIKLHEYLYIVKH